MPYTETRETRRIRFQPYDVRTCHVCGRMFCKDESSYDPYSEPICDSCEKAEDAFLERTFEKMLRNM